MSSILNGSQGSPRDIFNDGAIKFKAMPILCSICLKVETMTTYWSLYKSICISVYVYAAIS